MIDRIINRHLRDDQRDYPRRVRLSLWHWERVSHNQTPVLWLLSWLWWIPGLQWLWELRCFNVIWRMRRHNRRILAKAPELYTWARR